MQRINPGANEGLNTDAEVLKEYELMLQRHESKGAEWAYVNASDERAIMEIQKDYALNAWENEHES